MIEYEPGSPAWRLIFKWDGSVLPSAFLVAIPSSVASLLLVAYGEHTANLRRYIGIPMEESSILWTALTALLFSLIGYRTTQALTRFWEGTTLLHAMRGEWFDSASCLATFSFVALKEKPSEVMQFRQTLLRLMSLCHGSALDEIRCMENENYEVLDIQGLDETTLSILKDCKKHGFNRVEVILHMIQMLVINAQANHIIVVPPPILSRVYQTLSRGFVHLLSAKKIRDTRYPFPYAQLIAFMLSLMAILTPLVMSTLFKGSTWCAIVTFVPILTLYALNYTAEQLEMPYGDDPNDLPLSHFQQEMNSSLLMLIHPISDHVAHTVPEANVDYVALRNSLATARPALRYSESGLAKRNSIFSQPLGVASPDLRYSESSVAKRNSIFSQLSTQPLETIFGDSEEFLEDPLEESGEDIAGASLPSAFPESASGDQTTAPESQQLQPLRSNLPPGSSSPQADPGAGEGMPRRSDAEMGSVWGRAGETWQRADEPPPLLPRPMRLKSRMDTAASGKVAAEPSTSTANHVEKEDWGGELKPLRIHAVNRMSVPHSRWNQYVGRACNPKGSKQ